MVWFYIIFTHLTYFLGLRCVFNLNEEASSVRTLQDRVKEDGVVIDEKILKVDSF